MIKSQTLLSVSALTMAVASAYASPVMVANQNLNPSIEAGTTVEVTAGHPLWVKNDINHINKGSIVGDGELQFANYGKLENHGLIDVDKLTHPQQDHFAYANAVITNKDTGTINLRGEEFGVGLDNYGKVTASTGSLHMYDGKYKFFKGSSLTKTDGSMLDSLHIGREGDPNSCFVTINEGASLSAQEITIVNTATTVNGSLSADVLSVSGSQVIIGNKSVISGSDVSLGYLVARDGGSITASKALHLTDASELKNVFVNTPSIIAEKRIWLNGTTKIEGTKSVALGLGGLLIEDNAQFDGDHLDQLTLRGMPEIADPNHVAQVTLQGTHGLHIGQLTINKSTDANGNVLENKLIDKMKVTEEGKTSFDVDFLTVAEGAALSIYADDKTVEDQNFKKTNLAIGTLNVGDKATVKLGYREGDYEAFSSKSIGHLVLGTESVVDGGTSDKSKFAEIDQITFDGTKAKLTSTLTGDATDVFMNAGATGNTLSAVETGKFNVTLEKTAKDSLHVTHTNDKTVVNVVATPENNSGDAQKDLNEIAQSVVFDDKKAHNVTQEADDMNDAFSGTVIDGKVGNVKVEANSNININGIAEMTAVGLHIWRNEINDMNIAIVAMMLTVFGLAFITVRLSLAIKRSPISTRLSNLVTIVKWPMAFG